MQFSQIFAVAALAVSVAASSNGTVVYTTEIVTEYTTVCPAATTMTYNGVTITATESETITLPCPCTVVKPITTTSVVACNTCTVPTGSASRVYANSTSPAIPTTAVATSTKAAVGTTSAITVPAATSATVFTGGANKFTASGASLAGLVGLAAYLL